MSVRVTFAPALAALVVLFGSAAGTFATAAQPARAAPLDGALALVPVLDRASSASQGGDPTEMQLRYDAARDLAEATRAARIGSACEPLETALLALAGAHAAAAEAFDRLRSRGSLEARAVAARRQVDRLRATCTPGGTPLTNPRTRALTSPEPGAAFFGEVTGAVPPGTSTVQVLVNGRRAAVVPARGTGFVARVSGPSGLADVEALFVDATGRQIDAAVSRGAYLLPASSTAQAQAPRADAALSARLAATAARFPGYSAVYVERLATGASGSWNADSRFPAASTVKLGLMVEAARRFGYAPTSQIAYDLEQIGRWSSNLAANRLLRLVGSGDTTAGVRAVEARLRAMGATSSTYPGMYRAGTSRAIAPTQPPLTTGRVTTARDLGALMRSLLGAANGRREGAGTGLGAEGARSILRMLLESQSVSDNVGLLRPSLPRNLPVAQKNGWLRDTRSTAATLFEGDGPTLVVVLANRPQGMPLRDAQALGRAVVTSLNR